MSTGDYLVLLIILSLSTITAFSQEEATDLHGIKIQSGLYYDWSGETNYGGLRKAVLGYSRFKDDYLTELSLELSHYIVIGPEFLNETQIVGGEDREHLLVELEYFRSLSRRYTLDNQLHFGFFVSGIYSINDRNPYRPEEYPNATTCYCVSPGIKAIYTKRLANSIYFNASSKFNLATFGFVNEFNSDPQIISSLQNVQSFEIELLRLRLGIDFGFIFKI